MNKKNQGFTLIEIMIVVAIIAILAAVAIPNFIKYRNQSMRSSCISNMRQIQTAGEQYLMENSAAPTALTDICGGASKYIKKTPQCPAGNTDYTVGTDTDGAITVTCPNVGTYTDHVLPDTTP